MSIPTWAAAQQRTIDGIVAAECPPTYMDWASHFIGKDVIVTFADGSHTIGTFVDVLLYVPCSWALRVDDGRVQYINPSHVAKIIETTGQ